MIEISNKIFSYLNSIYDEKNIKEYIEFTDSAASKYIRVNTLKTNLEDLSYRLNNNYKIKTQIVKEIPDCLKIIEGSEKIGTTLEHINGLYYIQSLSSMLPALVLNPSRNDIVLDLCSAPGSKATQLGMMMENSGTLITNEIQLNRVKMLVYNLDRMNLINAGVTHSKGELLSKIYSDYFDKILVDAPCSGLGIIKKKGEINNWWSLQKVNILASLQFKLLIAAVKMLKVGGEVVYSTCTLTIEENELIINSLLKKYPVEVLEINLPVKSHEGFTSFKDEKLNSELSKAKRILPWEIDSDGFFILKLKKTGDTNPPKQINLKKNDLTFLNSNNKEIKKYLNHLSDEFGISNEVFSEFKFLIKRNDIFFVNKDWEDEYLSLFERIGTRFGTIDNRGKINFHTQAAQILQKNITKNIYEINDKGELKIYLEGGIIKDGKFSDEQYVIKFQNQILGTAVKTSHGLKSRFPRSKRTQEIVI